VARFGPRHDELRDRSKPHALPVVVEAAPRRHAVKVADVFRLRQSEEVLPGERDGIFYEPADLERRLAALDLTAHVRVTGEFFVFGDVRQEGK
jgi:hypothetical protein